MNRLPPLKPHQLSGLGKIRQARREGRVPLLVVAPCGGGKSRVITELAMDETRRGGRTVIKVHRKMLLDQLVGNFAAAGITPGVISPDYTPEPLHKIQIVSAQTVYSRAVLRSTLDMPEAQLVITDEAHQQSGTRERAIIFGSFQNNTVQVGYANNGADVIGFTATPLMNGRIYKHIIELASYSELRACGMHQLIATVGPTEIDTQGLNLNRAMEYSEKKLEERVQIIFGDVYSHWQVLNPMQLPTILFAPSVPSSRWFANQFFQRGVPVAHLDGTHCLIPEGGELKEYKTTRELRQHILDLSKAGEIKCIMNRFVLREAVDMPWLYHGITATVFGSVTTALQVVGRLQRKWPAYTHKILQDHGGCLDSETQILTTDGWKSQGEITKGDIVAAFNMETNAIEWQVARSTYVREVLATDQMHVIKSRCLDIRVTGNHKAIFKLRTTDKHNKPVWPTGFTKARFDEIACKSRMKVPISGQMEFSGSELPDCDIRFLGWWVTDGTINRTNVSISQKAGYVEHIKDIREVLKLCGFDWTETTTTYQDRHDATQQMIKFNIPKGTCKSKPRNGWARLEPYLDKGISPALDSMDQRQFDLFLYSMHLGDGSKDRNQGSYRIACGHRRCMDTLQSMAVRRGWKCNISKAKGREVVYVINIQRSTEANIWGVGKGIGNQASIKIEPPIAGERVWCVQNDLGTLVTRRNGKVAIVGNSFWRHGDPNEDREWKLGDTAKQYSLDRVKKIQSGEIPEGIRCPKCGTWRKEGEQCYGCNNKHKQSVRVVRQITGNLKRMTGRIYKTAKTAMTAPRYGRAPYSQEDGPIEPYPQQSSSTPIS
jgi:superfamily II DNA or RNA helicase